MGGRKIALAGEASERSCVTSAMKLFSIRSLTIQRMRRGRRGPSGRRLRCRSRSRRRAVASCCPAVIAGDAFIVEPLYVLVDLLAHARQRRCGCRAPMAGQQSRSRVRVPFERIRRSRRCGRRACHWLAAEQLDRAADRVLAGERPCGPAQDFDAVEIEYGRRWSRRRCRSRRRRRRRRRRARAWGTGSRTGPRRGC